MSDLECSLFLLQRALDKAIAAGDESAVTVLWEAYALACLDMPSLWTNGGRVVGGV